MARILVQLKLRLLRNALRASTAGKLSFIISLTFAVLVAAGTFTVLALLRGQRASVDVTTVIFTMFAFGWLILPIFVFGLDGTLDPATLALYPLRTRPLAVGLLAAWIGWKFAQRRRFLKKLAVARITAAELKTKLEAGEEIVVVDVRTALESEVDSVPGALRIPLEDLETRHDEIPRDRDIILFCS